MNLVKYLEEHEEGGNPAYKAQTSPVPICCSLKHSMKEMEIQEGSYSSKHSKGSRLKLTMSTSVCCDFGFHKGSSSQEGSCTHGNRDLWMHLILVTTNKQVSKLNQMQIRKVPPFPLLFVPNTSELLGTIKNKRQLQKKNKVPRIITTQIFIQQ